VGEVPAVRASVGCGCVEFCLVWAPLPSFNIRKHNGDDEPEDIVRVFMTNFCT
jgi:hypothetical protein